MKNPEVKTYGCRLNFYESEVIRKFAKENNLQDRTFINSCAVTNKTIADLKTEIRKLKKNDPYNKIILTGCAAQIHKDEFVAMNEIDSIIGNKEKLESKTYKEIKESNDRINKVGDIFEHGQAISPIIKKVENRIRGFVQIQNGCDHRCTFCIIPYGRGDSRSVEPENVVNQINTLLDQGYKEIVLTGVDLTSYGHDLENKPNLATLVSHILFSIPNLKRLRLSSLDVAEIDKNLMDLIKYEKRILPHIHLSLQAEVVFGADIIAGFPTENDEMFQNTVDLIEDCNITFLHIFPFSPREGTPAARMPQVDRYIIKKRAKILREIGKKKLLEYYDGLKNKKINVIVEDKGRGRSDTFAKVQIDNNLDNGQIVKMIVTGRNQVGLTGNIVV